MPDFDVNEIITEIIRTEGGYVNHPDDRGGPTKYGITQETLSNWRKTLVTKQDVEALKVEEAREIYEVEYIIKPNFHKIKDERLKYLVIDAGVHSGPQRAAQWLQGCIKAKADCIIGPMTLQALYNYPDGQELRKKYLATRISFLGLLITRDPKQATFAAGWMHRMAKLLTDVV